MSRWSTWAPVVSAVAVAGLVIGVSVALTGGGADGPPTLRLASGGGTTDEAAASPRSAGSSGFRLIGTLPDGPTSAAVRDLPAGAAPVAKVRELAKALGVDEAPERVVGAWRAGDLRVGDEAGHPWSFGPGSDCGPDTAVSSDESVVTCTAPAPGSGGGSSGSGSSGSVGSSCAQPEPYPAPPTDCHVEDPAGTPADQPKDTPAPGANGRAALPALTCPPPPPGSEPVPCNDTPPFECGPAATCAVPPTQGIDCGGAVGKGSCSLPGPVMSEGEALQFTERLRTALGLSDADLRTSVSYDSAVVTADPRAGGLRTRGFATTLVLDARKQLTAANGWLSDGRAGAAYPLVSAKAAFERLASPAMGAPALGRPCDAKDGCPEPAPVDVDGAELGLVLTPLQDEQSALVPAWLFSLAGADDVLVQLAVEDRYVDDGSGSTEPGVIEPGVIEPGVIEPAPVDPGTEPGTGADPGDGPGTTEPGTRPGTTDPAVPPPSDPAKPAEPSPGGSEPNPGRQTMGFDGAIRGEQPSVLTIRYGKTCTSGVTAAVKESADTVFVLLEQDAQPPDRMCPAIYEAAFLDLKLQSPLGDRKVVDGSSGREVAVTTCPSKTEMCPPG